LEIMQDYNEVVVIMGWLELIITILLAVDSPPIVSNQVMFRRLKPVKLFFSTVLILRSAIVNILV
jgi:hypothetical protein